MKYADRATLNFNNQNLKIMNKKVNNLDSSELELYKNVKKLLDHISFIVNIN